MNSQLYGNTYNISPEILATIQSALIQYPNSEGIKRAKNLLGSKTVTYQSLKRLKNFFDTYNPQTTPTEQYQLSGGDKMKGWVETVLNSERQGVKQNTETTSDMHVNNQGSKLSNPNPLQKETLDQLGNIMTETMDLNENPDHIDTKNSYDSWNDGGAYPFAMLKKDKCVLIGNEGSTHGGMIKAINKNIKDSTQFVEIEQYLDRDDINYKGRIWLNNKVISFWDYPPKEILQNYMLDLEKAFKDTKFRNVKIWNDPEFKIEIRNPDENYHNDNYEKSNYNENILIPLKQYTQSQNPSAEELQQHLKSPLQKKAVEVPQGLGSKRYGEKLPIDVRQKLQTSENIIKETPDSIEYDNIILHYNDDNTYPFGITKNGNNLYIGDESATHDSLIPNERTQRFNFYYAGRIWLSDKVISFWQYPPKEKLKKIILDLENAFKEQKGINIQIWNDKQYEIELHDNDYYNDYNSTLIPLQQYVGSENPKSVEHIKSPLQKKSVEIPQGVGSKRYGENLPIDVRQKLQTSESVNEGAKDEINEGIKVCAIAIIFNADHKILLLKRSSSADWCPNKWSFVGGGMEEGENEIQAIQREVGEETGLDIKTYIEKFSIKREGLEEHVFVAKYTGEDDDVELNDENTAYMWASPNDFKFLDTVPNFNEYLKLMLEEY